MSRSAADDRKRPPPPSEDDGGGKRPAAAKSEDEDTCWLCLDAVHETGAPLRRECSCRGGSGFAHLPCLVEYAKDWSQKHERDMVKFGRVWKDCPNCEQEYGDQLGFDMATAMGEFVQSKYPESKIHTLASLLISLLNLMQRKNVPNMRELARGRTERILEMVAEMKAEQSPLPHFARNVEFQAYFTQAFITLDEGSASEAVLQLEQCLGIARGLENAGFVYAVEAVLARAKSRCDGESNGDASEELEHNRKLHKTCVATAGEGDLSTITSGGLLAASLKAAHHGIEAERLLTKLATSSKRVLGPERDETKQILAELKYCKKRSIGIKSREGGDFQALRCDENSGEYLVKNKSGETFSVAAGDVIFAPGTPVICNGLEASSQFNGKIGDVRSFDEPSQSYKIYFEEGELEPQLICGKFLRILFELPPRPSEC
ncbi:hypothetical protein ACHAXT_003473 [Thalassiosira profunda]